MTYNHRTRNNETAHELTKAEETGASNDNQFLYLPPQDRKQYYGRWKLYIHLQDRNVITIVKHETMNCNKSNNAFINCNTNRTSKEHFPEALADQS